MTVFIPDHGDTRFFNGLLRFPDGGFSAVVAWSHDGKSTVPARVDERGAQQTSRNDQHDGVTS